jgi:hypothetical protein
MSKQTKPSIVLVHGIWADGSCFSKLIPAFRRRYTGDRMDRVRTRSSERLGQVILAGALDKIIVHDLAKRQG